MCELRQREREYEKITGMSGPAQIKTMYPIPNHPFIDFLVNFNGLGKIAGCSTVFAFGRNISKQ